MGMTDENMVYIGSIDLDQPIPEQIDKILGRLIGIQDPAARQEELLQAWREEAVGELTRMPLRKTLPTPADVIKIRALRNLGRQKAADGTMRDPLPSDDDMELILEEWRAHLDGSAEAIRGWMLAWACACTMVRSVESKKGFLLTMLHMCNLWEAAASDKSVHQAIVDLGEVEDAEPAEAAPEQDTP